MGEKKEHRTVLNSNMAWSPKYILVGKNKIQNSGFSTLRFQEKWEIYTCIYLCVHNSMNKQKMLPVSLVAS